MDTTKRDEILKNFVLIALPDDEKNVNGPATLYQVPREAVVAYVKMTRDLNQQQEVLEDTAVKEAIKSNPAAFAEFVAGKKTGVKTSTKFMEDVLNEQRYVNAFNTILTVGIMGMIKEWGINEFRRDYAVTDHEVISDFMESGYWTTFEPGKGWGEEGDANERMRFNQNYGELSIKPPLDDAE